MRAWIFNPSALRSNSFHDMIDRNWPEINLLNNTRYSNVRLMTGSWLACYYMLSVVNYIASVMGSCRWHSRQTIDDIISTLPWAPMTCSVTADLAGTCPEEETFLRSAKQWAGYCECEPGGQQQNISSSVFSIPTRKQGLLFHFGWRGVNEQ